MNKLYTLAIACALTICAPAFAQCQDTTLPQDYVAPPPATHTIILYCGSQKKILDLSETKLSQWHGDRSDNKFDNDCK